jgi:hypothetical protein
LGTSKKSAKQTHFSIEEVHMTRHVRQAVLAGLVSFGALSGALAQDINPSRVALLRWYPVNNVAEFPTGLYPKALVFDGANIWTLSGGDGSLTKLRANDGGVLATYAVGGLGGMAFDGANIWVGGNGGSGGTLIKVRARDGVVLGTFITGLDSTPSGVAFDGTNMWAVTPSSSFVVKVRASDGVVLGAYPVGSFPGHVAFDGSNVWVGGTPITKLRASDGTNLGSVSVWAQALAFDGANVWCHGPSQLAKVRASDGAILGTYSGGGGTYGGIVFDGENIWVPSQTNNWITVRRASDGMLIGQFPAGPSPMAVTFDGANVWVANFMANSVSKR